MTSKIVDDAFASKNLFVARHGESDGGKGVEHQAIALSTLGKPTYSALAIENTGR